MLVFIHSVVGDVQLVLLARNFLGFGQDIFFNALLFLALLLAMFLLHLLHFYPIAAPMHLWLCSQHLDLASGSLALELHLVLLFSFWPPLCMSSCVVDPQFLTPFVFILLHYSWTLDHFCACLLSLLLSSWPSLCKGPFALLPNNYPSSSSSSTTTVAILFSFFSYHFTTVVIAFLLLIHLNLVIS